VEVEIVIARTPRSDFRESCVQKDTLHGHELERIPFDCIFYMLTERYYTYHPHLFFPCIRPLFPVSFRMSIHLLLSAAPGCADREAAFTGSQSPQRIGSELWARAVKPGILRHAADSVAHRPLLVPYLVDVDFPFRNCAVITYTSILSPPVVVSGERTAATAAVGNAGTRN
jgi:hypothetical protein